MTDAVTLNLRDGPLSVTLADGEQLAAALAEPSGARIDGDGTLRIGPWLLQELDGEPVLVRREAAGRAFLVAIARLAHGGDGWSVRSVDQRTVERR